METMDQLVPEQQEMARRLTNFWHNSFVLGSGVERQLTGGTQSSIVHFNNDSPNFSELRLDMTEGIVMQDDGALAIGINQSTLGQDSRDWPKLMVGPWYSAGTKEYPFVCVGITSDLSRVFPRPELEQDIPDRVMWRRDMTRLILSRLIAYHDDVTSQTLGEKKTLTVRVDEPSLTKWKEWWNET